MGPAKKFLRFANDLVTLAVVLALLLAGAYAGYALWDNNRVYASARNVRDDMLKLKPDVGGLTEAFHALREVNPDVRAWLTLDNTNIDYPVVQGIDNMTYVNMDVYGEFALAGSIFLDAGCDGEFRAPYSLLYGHHMEKSQMFGDLDLFKDETFFRRNRTGMLILPDRAYELEVFACLVLPSNDAAVFRPQRWSGGVDELLDYAGEQALFTRDAIISELRAGDTPQVLAMSTCSAEFTDARTVLLARMLPTTTI